MSEDFGLIILGVAAVWFTIWLLRKKVSKRFLWFNLACNVVYTSYFIYGLKFMGSGGTSLGWLVYLLIILLVHSLVNLVCSFVLRRKF